MWRRTRCIYPTISRPREDRFALIEYEPGRVAGVRRLLGAFSCEKYQQVDGGDHWIMIGKVVAFDDFGRAPLLYHQGAYAEVRALPPCAPGGGLERHGDHQLAVDIGAVAADLIAAVFG